MSCAHASQKCSTSQGVCHRNFHVSRRLRLKTRHPQVSLQATSTTTSMTQSVFERLAEISSQSGGAGGTTTWDAFLRADEAWSRLRNMKEGAAAGPAPTFVTVSSQPLPPSTTTPLAAAPASGPAHQPPEVWDVAVCGGTLGVFLAAALAQRGLRVAVIERGPLMGRQQEWNVSRKELKELCECGLLSEGELESAISMEFNPVRVGFKGGGEVWTKDVLNCGVSPDSLIQGMRRKLEARQGIVLDRTGLQGIDVHPDGVSLSLTGGNPQAGSTTLEARLVIDCMGHASPVVKQIRWGRKPDGVCIVVGTLASGFKDNTTADVIYTHTDLQPASAKASRLQLFWEAFPAGSGPTDRTTYMFTYMDASPWRPSMLDLFEEYWPLMSSYQGMDLEDLTFKRALFGMFPTFRDSPLKPAFDRVLQVGDASGIQSPLSFGGFGALTRHLRRITGAVADALEVDALDKHNLGLIHAYNPGLSSSWMMQRAMSVRQTDNPPQDLINRMLGGNFQAMERLGDPVMKPFLQDVIQLGPLLSTMGQQMVTDPRTVPQLIMHVGPGPLLDWTKHVGALGLYTALHHTIRGPLLSLAGNKALKPKQQFALKRYVEALEFGAGLDYKL